MQPKTVQLKRGQAFFAASSAVATPASAAAAMPGGYPPEKKPETAPVPSAHAQSESKRRRNRWGMGLEVTAAGQRGFITPGFTPQGSVADSLQAFGMSVEQISNLSTRAEQKNAMLKGFGMLLALPHVFAILAYTDENPLLYPVLNSTMRSTGATAEAKLKAFMSYIYFLSSALDPLPAHLGKVFRGIDVLVPEAAYPLGQVITWQPFSSATKSVFVTMSFLKGAASKKPFGTLFVIDSISGKEIEDLSIYPDEAEVLFKMNSFFRVEAILTTDEDKVAVLPELSSYNLEDLKVIRLQQL